MGKFALIVYGECILCILYVPTSACAKKSLSLDGISFPVNSYTLTELGHVFCGCMYQTIGVNTALNFFFLHDKHPRENCSWSQLGSAGNLTINQLGPAGPSYHFLLGKYLTICYSSTNMIFATLILSGHSK